jgi:hypothetical protein
MDLAKALPFILSSGFHGARDNRRERERAYAVNCMEWHLPREGMK